MRAKMRTLWLVLMLLPTASLQAEVGFAISPTLGIASIQNIDGYDHAAYFRLDGSFYPIPQLGIHLFGSQYQDFEASSPNLNGVAIGLTGFGMGVSGRWPLHPHIWPYVRAEYLLWQAKAYGLGQTLAEDEGGSIGFALGLQFPIKAAFALKTELNAYNDVSGADIRQFALGLHFEF